MSLREFYPFIFDDDKPFLVKNAYRFFVCFLAHPEQAVYNIRRAFIGYGNSAAARLDRVEDGLGDIIDPLFGSITLLTKYNFGYTIKL